LRTFKTLHKTKKAGETSAFKSFHYRQHYLFSFTLWHKISIEKLNAKAKAMDCQSDSLEAKEKIIITKQNALVTTVRAFFSDKYLFI